MKLATAWGGFAGFTLAMAGGYFAGREPVMLLLDGCLACLLGAWLFQWAHRIFVRNVNEALGERREEAAAAEAVSDASKTHTART